MQRAGLSARLCAVASNDGTWRRLARHSADTCMSMGTQKLPDQTLYAHAYQRCG
ncbi:hypothetical protein ANO14919_029950 [Xylariales sp. No.14919]|nr:hypothetical protein ANO14919_029950 [Xylariales sp. No.14919]